MFLSCSGILAKAISIESSSLQQIQSISLASFLQYPLSEAVVWSCSVKNVLLKILQNSLVFTLAQEFPVNFAKFWRKLFFIKHLQWLLLAFAPIEISYSNTVCNKSAAEVWICLVSFYGGAKDFIFTCIFLRIITFFIKI